jgi:hypothetical protein
MSNPSPTRPKSLVDRAAAARDLTVLEREEEGNKQPIRKSRIERFDWRGEGVVGDNHTD